MSESDAASHGTSRRAHPIPLQLSDAGQDAAPGIEIDGTLVAQKLGLETAAFRQLMQDGKVSVLCERGVGEDAGFFRATFYFEDRRFRAVLDGSGNLVHAEP